jgi:hypothetical protein
LNPIEPKGDGVFSVRRLKKGGEQFLRVRADMSGEYRRFTEDDGERIIFQKV